MWGRRLGEGGGDYAGEEMRVGGGVMSKGRGLYACGGWVYVWGEGSISGRRGGHVCVPCVGSAPLGGFHLCV